VTNGPPQNGGPPGGTPGGGGGGGPPPPGGPPDPELPIGDFEGSNALWKLFGEQAKSHDEATIQTLKTDMDGLLIFVCSYFVHACGSGHTDP
jgi:hypothetical protein